MNLLLYQFYFKNYSESFKRKVLMVNFKLCDHCETARLILTECSCHVTYAFHSESTLSSCLNVKELLARNKRKIWSLSDCIWTRTHNRLVHKRTLNHLAKLAKWLSCLVSTYLYSAFDCMSLSCHVRVSEWIFLRTKWLWFGVQFQSPITYTVTVNGIITKFVSCSLVTNGPALTSESKDWNGSIWWNPILRMEGRSYQDQVNVYFIFSRFLKDLFLIPRFVSIFVCLFFCLFLT